jgi:uncharacterized protein (DUF362 family)
MWTRRTFLRSLSAPAVALSPAGGASVSAKVAVARCSDYGSELLPAFEQMFDQIGGLGRLVNGKTVAVKLNLTGPATNRLGHLPAGMAHWVNESVVEVVIHLLGKSGARRIRLLEGSGVTSLPEHMLLAGWEPERFASAAKHVEFENTNLPDSADKAVSFKPPNGGLLFPAYHLSPSFRDCDVFVSLTKLKEHVNAGVTLSMKNCFGNTPSAIYNRGTMFHFGQRQPPAGIPAENDPSTSRDPGYRLPRVIADLVAARPIDLAIIDGVASMAGGEGPWNKGACPCRPHLLVAGTNGVATDAVGTALMGFDPMADRGETPFEVCDSTLRLAEELGAGPRDLNRIEVVGTPIQEAVFRMRDASRRG